MEVLTEIIVDADADRVFAVLADLRQYCDWLPHSDVHTGIEVTGDGPVQAGTTYVDRGRGGANMSGEVRRCDPPSHLAFCQEVTLPIGTMVAQTEFRLQAEGDGTRVVRHQHISLPWLMWPFQPLARMKIRGESRRVLDALKRAVEADAEAPQSSG